MLNDDELFGIDKNSGFSLRVLILSIPCGSIFLILSIFNILPSHIAIFSYISLLFFNAIFLMPISTEIQQIKKYISKLSSGTSEEELLNNITEKETKDLISAINSMHKFWSDKNQMLENRTLSDAAVLDTLPDPLILIEKEAHIIGSNLSARKLFQNKLNNINLISIIDNPKFVAALNKVLTGTSRNEELSINLDINKNKPKFHIRISMLPWFAKGDIVAVVSFYDLEKVLILEKMQQDFVANASHELRTPLSIISGFIETLQTTAKNDKNAQEKFLNIMQEQANFMSALIENLLSLSKIELSIDTLPNEKIKLNEIIREVSSALELKAKNKSLKIENKLPRIPQITADNYQITQIIQNILDNAIKYSVPDSTITIKTAKVNNIPQNKFYDVALTPAIKISIKNKANIISTNDINRLTERFYRLQEHKNQNIKGTGLGLSIVTQIIRRHLGNYEIENNDEEFCFNIYLPISFETK